MHHRPGAVERKARRLGATVAAVTVLGLSAFLVPSASAAPTPTIAQVQASVSKLQDQAEQASEQYDETTVKLASVNVRLRAAKAKLARQRIEVANARTEVGRLAAETYRRGQLSALDVVLGDDPDAALAQAGYLPSLGMRQTGAMKRLSQQELVLDATQQDIAAQQHKVAVAQLKLQQTKNTVNQRLAQAQAELAQLKASERRRLQQAQFRVASAGVPSGGSASMCLSMASQAGSAGARTALTFACNQLGDPYVWAAAGPGTWDCSGLTMRAWQAAGVSLPHSSILQSGFGTRVALSDLQPGDLLFFGAPIHHVAIYLGNGLMVHAPHTGDVVRVATVYETPSAAIRL